MRRRGRGFLRPVRGGREPERDPAALSRGKVLRMTEPDMAGAACFDLREIRDPKRPEALDAAIRDALAAFQRVMDGCRLTDLRVREQK